MLRQFGILKILPAFIIGFFVARMMGQGDAQDIFRFILSVLLYSAGFLLIIWSLTSGKKKDSSNNSTIKDQRNLEDKENSEKS